MLHKKTAEIQRKNNQNLNDMGIVNQKATHRQRQAYHKKVFKNSLKHFAIWEKARTFAPFSKRNEDNNLKQSLNTSQAISCKWKQIQRSPLNCHTQERISFQENYTGA